MIVATAGAPPRLPNICCSSARKLPQLRLVGIACFSGQLPLATPRQSPTLRLNYANCRCRSRCTRAMTLKRQHGNCLSRWLVSVAAFAAPPHHFSAAPAPVPVFFENAAAVWCALLSSQLLLQFVVWWCLPGTVVSTVTEMVGSIYIFCFQEIVFEAKMSVEFLSIFRSASSSSYAIPSKTFGRPRKHNARPRRESQQILAKYFKWFWPCALRLARNLTHLTH